MLKIEKTKHFTTYATVWYAEKKINKKGMIRYRSAQNQLCDRMTAFHTLLSDLTESEEEITARFSKNCRYEIRRAAREEVICECRMGKELSKQEIEDFAQFFSDFWKSKGVTDSRKEKYVSEIMEYVKEDAFAISTAKVGDQILVYHTYIADPHYIRLYQSASQFRTEEEIPGQLIGMANRLLHKEDMLYFKEHEFAVYDWGGAGRGEEVASITKFKESFGGTPAVWYDGEETAGIKAKCLKFLISIIGKVIK